MKKDFFCSVTKKYYPVFYVLKTADGSRIEYFGYRKFSTLNPKSLRLKRGNFTVTHSRNRYGDKYIVVEDRLIKEDEFDCFFISDNTVLRNIDIYPIDYYNKLPLYKIEAIRRGDKILVVDGIATGFFETSAVVIHNDDTVEKTNDVVEINKRIHEILPCDVGVTSMRIIKFLIHFNEPFQNLIDGLTNKDPEYFPYAIALADQVYMKKHIRETLKLLVIEDTFKRTVYNCYDKLYRHI